MTDLTLFVVFVENGTVWLQDLVQNLKTTKASWHAFLWKSDECPSLLSLLGVHNNVIKDALEDVGCGSEPPARFRFKAIKSSQVVTNAGLEK